MDSEIRLTASVAVTLGTNSLTTAPRAAPDLAHRPIPRLMPKHVTMPNCGMEDRSAEIVGAFF